MQARRRKRIVLLLGSAAAVSALALVLGPVLRNVLVPGAPASPPRSLFEEQRAHAELASGSAADRSEARLRPEAVANPAPQRASSTREAAWAPCLDLADPETLRSCVRQRLGREVSAEDLAEWVCRDGREFEQHFLLVSEALARVPAAHALGWLEAFQETCPRYQESWFLHLCLSWVRSRDPGWEEVFRSSFTPERLFDPARGETAVQLACAFARDGDLSLRAWLEEGARGEWGGSELQIDRALAVSAGMHDPGSDWLDYLRSVAQAPSTPAGEHIGSTLVAALLHESARLEGDRSSAFDTLEEVLYDPRFQSSAAAMVLRGCPETAPEGGDAGTWRAIRDRAREIAEALKMQPSNEH